MLCAVEETFGPVVAVSRFSSEDEAVHLANDTPFGLALPFYSASAARIARVADRLEAGIVGINEVCWPPRSCAFRRHRIGLWTRRLAARPG